MYNTLLQYTTILYIALQYITMKYFTIQYNTSKGSTIHLTCNGQFIPRIKCSVPNSHKSQTAILRIKWWDGSRFHRREGKHRNLPRDIYFHPLGKKGKTKLNINLYIRKRGSECESTENNKSRMKVIPLYSIMNKDQMRWMSFTSFYNIF